MGKPSIFSRDYENRMKRRKRRIIIIIALLIICGGIFLQGGNLKSAFNNKFLAVKNFNFKALIKKNSKDQTNVAKEDKNKATTNSQNTTPALPKVVENGIDIVLSDGTKIEAVYENKDGVNKFKYVTPIDAPVSFCVNPSGSALVILENSTQTMIYATIDGKVRNISDTKYISTGGSVFPKEEILKQKPNFVWCASPKFIDDNFVAYISQVPWFTKTAKYVWVFNINDSNIKDRNNHMLFESLGGENVKLNNITDKGLEVVSDNITRYLKSDGQSIKISE